jgi:hypothetical protein
MSVSNILDANGKIDELFLNPLPALPGMSLSNATDFGNVAPTANPTINLENPWVVEGPLDVSINDGLIEFFIKPAIAKTGPYMIQIVFTVDAASVITPGEFIRLDMFDNVTPQTRYFGGVMVIPTDNLKAPSAPTNANYPTNTFTYNTVVWLDTSRVSFDPFIWLYIQQGAGVSPQTTKISNCQIAVYPMFSK